MIAPITVLGTAAAVVCLFWPAASQLLIRFTGPEVWWVLHVAHWAAGVPAATVPVPAGVPGVLVVGGATLLAILLAMLLWRWHWCRTAAAVVLALVVICLLAWLLSEVLDPGTD